MKYLKSMLVFMLLLSLTMSSGLHGQVEYEGGGLKQTEFERVGMSGFQFIKMPTKARMAALGGIRTAISSENSASAFANPAAIAGIKNFGFSFTQMRYVADIMYFSGSFAKDFGKWGVLGLNIINLDYGDITRTYWGQDEQSNPIPVIDGTYTGGDVALGLSYARRVTNRLQVGGTFRYFSETLDSRDAISTTNWAIDIGTIYYTGIRSLRIAMLGSNFGPDAEFVEFDERLGILPVQVQLPAMFSLGAAYDFFDGEGSRQLMTVSVEFVHPNDGLEKAHLGVEYSLLDMLSLRAGYRFNYDEDGLSLGAGFKVSVANHNVIEVNYAFMDFGRLGTNNMFSLAYSFE